jgi:hypothetical protein
VVLLGCLSDLCEALAVLAKWKTCFVVIALEMKNPLLCADRMKIALPTSNGPLVYATFLMSWCVEKANQVTPWSLLEVYINISTYHCCSD